MLQRTKIAVGVLALALGLPMLGSGAALRVGEKAPNFALPDQNGHEVSLSQFLGKENVVLAFYVLAFTGG
jgi:peroxiredoxin